MWPLIISELIPWARKIEFESCKYLKTRSDSELSKKNGRIIRPKGIFFETFWANSSGGFGGSQTFFRKKSVFHLVSSLSLFTFSVIFSLLFHPVSSFLVHLLSSCSSCLFSCLAHSLFLSYLFSSFDLLLSSCLVSPPSSSLVLSRLSSFIFSCLVSSLLLHLLLSSCLVPSSLVLFCLVLSLFLSLSPCDVVCCVVWCVSLWSWCCLVVVVCLVCVCVCSCVCVAARRKKRGRVVPAYTGTF